MLVKIVKHGMEWECTDIDSIDMPLDCDIRIDKSKEHESIQIIFGENWNHNIWKGEFIRRKKNEMTFRITCDAISGKGEVTKFKKKSEGMSGNWYYFEDGVKVNESWDIGVPLSV